jgi:hypothetical protein
MKVKFPVDKNIETPPHEHDWEIIKQITLPLLTHHNYYRCKICFEKKDDYENPMGKFNI